MASDDSASDDDLPLSALFDSLHVSRAPGAEAVVPRQPVEGDCCAARGVPADGVSLRPYQRTLLDDASSLFRQGAARRARVPPHWRR